MKLILTLLLLIPMCGCKDCGKIINKHTALETGNTSYQLRIKCASGYYTKRVEYEEYVSSTIGDSCCGF